MTGTRWLLAIVLLLGGCTGLPKNIEPVSGFELERYLGSWYEIARLDHRFERGLIRVTAEYQQRDDGKLRVINRGFNLETGQWTEAEGKATFKRSADIGHLKVSFFGPFYASYVVFELDRVGYQYAFVTGHDKDYLWLLSRTPVIDETLRSRFIERAKKEGFNTDALIWVEQSV